MPLTVMSGCSGLSEDNTPYSLQASNGPWINYFASIKGPVIIIQSLAEPPSASWQL